MSNLRMLLFSGGQSERNQPYYHYCHDWLQDYLKQNLPADPKVLFISWAVWGGHDADKMFGYGQDHWGQFGLKLSALHQQEDYLKAIESADAIIVGGGSIHMLVNDLEKTDVMPLIKEKVRQGCLYIGTSAGSIIAGPTMHTASEPALIHIPSHRTLGILPFQLNAHYYEVDSDQFHNGPTPEARIKNYLQLNPEPRPVVCMRDGSFLHIQNDSITVRGVRDITTIDLLLRKETYKPGSSLKSLLNFRGRYYKKRL